MVRQAHHERAKKGHCSLSTEAIRTDVRRVTTPRFLACPEALQIERQAEGSGILPEVGRRCTCHCPREAQLWERSPMMLRSSSAIRRSSG